MQSLYFADCAFFNSIINANEQQMYFLVIDYIPFGYFMP